MQIRLELSAHGSERTSTAGAASPSPALDAARRTAASVEAPLTIDVLRAAVMAIRAGAFDDVDGRDVDVATQAAARRAVTLLPPGGCPPWPGGTAGRAVVLVLAGHAGAGASMVALALAEALTACGSVLLVECAEPLRSGLAAASSVELGLDEAGWRRGRRGGLEIGRLARPLPPGSELPPPSGGVDRLLVVDLGWALTTALLGSDPREWLTGSERVVVVTRLTVPAVRQAEHLLAALCPQVSASACVAAVGPNRWPRGVEANYGPHLSRLEVDGRVVRMPMEPRLEGSGLTADPLPKSFAGAGRALADALGVFGPANEPR